MDTRTIRQVIDARCASEPDQPFLLDGQGSSVLSIRDICESAHSLAAFLREKGVQPGQSVAFAMSNGAHAAATLLGLFYGGYRAVAVNLVSGAGTIGYVLEHSESRLVLSEEKHLALIADAQDKVGLSLDVYTAWQDVASTASVPEPVGTSDALLMYTSGTTGRPKGVLHTHASLLAGGDNTALAHELTRDDRALCVLPLYHINGLCVTLMGPLVSGGSVVMPPKFSASGFWPLIERHACTWFSVVPTQISWLLHDEQSDAERVRAQTQLRFGRSASAPLSPEVQQSFEERFGVPIVETMGLTETAAQILSNPLPPGIRKIGSPGVAVGNNVMIADEHQQECQRGEEGEILIRGANVMQRYFRNVDATEAALTSDGWLRSGDLGRMDKDGYVFVTGRLKELIIKGGENIAPREVDEALYCHDKVIEAAAFALACPDFGQRVEAAVAIDADADVTEAELLALCHARIGRFKSPDRIHFLDELPKGPSGKIQRLKIAECITT